MESCVNIVGRRSRTFKEFSVAVICFFLFICFCATYISCNSPQILSESMCLWSTKAGCISFKMQKWKRNNIVTTVNDITPPRIGGARGRLLRSLGSSPPRCTSKCGRCTPCKPVHVPVPPGTPVTTEYYPEAWRCKCGNNLYMP